MAGVMQRVGPRNFCRIREIKNKFIGIFAIAIIAAPIEFQA